jgi:hypothetical protein
MTDQHIAGIAELEAERDGLRGDLAEAKRQWWNYQSVAVERHDQLTAARAEIAIHRKALEVLLYTATHLSPRSADGSHYARIPEHAIRRARAALALPTTAPQPAMSPQSESAPSTGSPTPCGNCSMIWGRTVGAFASARKPKHGSPTSRSATNPSQSTPTG